MFSVLKSESVSENDFMRIIVILERPYAFLRGQLKKAFESQSDVMIVVDRRYVERRHKKDLFSQEHRHGDRRRSQDQIGKAVISA